MKTLKNYLKYSNFKVSVDFSPYCWSFKYMHERPTRTDPKLHQFYLRLLPISFMLVIDDGTIVPYREALDDFPEIVMKDQIGDEL